MEVLHVNVQCPDDRHVTIDVSVLQPLGHRKGVERVDTELRAPQRAIDWDELASDDSFRAFVADVTQGERDGAVVRAACMRRNRGKLLARLGVSGPEPDPIPYRLDA